MLSNPPPRAWVHLVRFTPFFPYRAAPRVLAATSLKWHPRRLQDVSVLERHACQARLVVDRSKIDDIGGRQQPQQQRRRQHPESQQRHHQPSSRVGVESSGDLRCPVCLDPVTGAEAPNDIITTVCNHVFHGECLAKCPDVSCPVCRHAPAVDSSPNRCSDCDAREVTPYPT